MFKVVLNDGQNEMPEDDIFYIIAKEGVYLKKKLGVMESIAPVKNISILESVNSMAKMHITKIPAKWIAKVISFFQAVYEEHRSEAIVLLFYDEETGTLKIGKSIAYVLLIVVVLSVIVWVAKVVTRPARTASDIIERTLDADNVIYNYEWFKQIVEDIEAMEKKVEITAQSVEDFKDLHSKPYDEWTFDDKNEMSRLRTDLRGQRAHLEQLKADFRARAKMANRTIFKGDNSIIKWVDDLVGVEE